ncbi:hypothetical protein K440DRAFT_573997, partial [Wilcoxina mikolae CBS 423.85]
AFANAIHKHQFKRDPFKELLIQWIVTNNISFGIVEQCSFRLLLSYLMACVCLIPCIIVLLLYGSYSIPKTALYTAIPGALPGSGNTIQNWIIARY